MDGVTLSTYRVIITTLILLPLATRMSKIKGNAFFFLIFLGLLNLMVILLYFISIKSVGVSLSTLFLYLGNLYFAVISIPIFKEKLRKRLIISVFLSLVGMILTFSNLNEDNWKGILLAGLSGVLSAIVLVIGKVLAKEVSGIQITFYQNLIASLVIFPVILGNPITRLNDLYAILALSVFCTIIPFSLLYSGMRDLEGQKIGITLSLRVIIPVLIEFLVFHEIPNISKIIGCSLVLISLLIIAYKKSFKCY